MFLLLYSLLPEVKITAYILLFRILFRPLNFHRKHFHETIRLDSFLIDQEYEVVWPTICTNLRWNSHKIHEFADLLSETQSINLLKFILNLVAFLRAAQNLLNFD